AAARTPLRSAEIWRRPRPTTPTPTLPPTSSPRPRRAPSPNKCVSASPRDIIAEMGRLRVLLALVAASCGSPSDPGMDDTPLEQWAWVDVPGMTCGNGSPTGIAINRSTRSSRLVLMFEGGGACWEVAACYGIGIQPTSVHLDGFT